MSELDLMVCLFPTVFMIHEFEEIIGFKLWVNKNSLWLKGRFPKLAKQVSHLEHLSVSAFALAVLEEFVVVGIITVLALTLHWYSLWIAAFTAFAFHILVHIVQWIVVRKYIPVIITSLLCVPYIVWGVNKLLAGFSVNMIFICFIVGVLVASVNLHFVHKLASRFDKEITE